MAPELDENATATQKEMWKIRANNTIKREELLEANMEAMYKVVMSICNPVLKDQICNHDRYEEIYNKQETLGLLKIIKKTITQMERMTRTWATIMYKLLSHTAGEVSITTRIS